MNAPRLRGSDDETSGRETARKSTGAEACRRVIVVSADAGLRARIGASLRAMRWHVDEATGGAAALLHMETSSNSVLLLDDWLPDLEISEFVRTLNLFYPGTDVLRMDGSNVVGELITSFRHELLHAIRESHTQSYLEMQSDGSTAESAFDGGIANAASVTVPKTARQHQARENRSKVAVQTSGSLAPKSESDRSLQIEGMVGDSAGMLELARLIRLVAPRSSTVLIEGETGSGKEIVAQALQRLSTRAHKPIVVLNCAAIPEALLEAELFGHARGAFTGAVQSRTGRIEAANGGTLFLDEIGEMPLALQAKMLRFLECGELQRVGENQIVRVDVRVIAATHQHLEERATTGKFRLDLYHRLAVFPIEVPPLRQRKEDIPALSWHFLARLGISAPRKQISQSALDRLTAHEWPGNVRELAHVLERATILAADAPVLSTEHIRLRGAGVSRNKITEG